MQSTTNKKTENKCDSSIFAVEYLLSNLFSNNLIITIAA